MPNERLHRLIEIAAQSITEAERLEGLGGPRRTAKAKELRVSASLWLREAAQLTIDGVVEVAA